MKLQITIGLGFAVYLLSSACNTEETVRQFAYGRNSLKDMSAENGADATAETTDKVIKNEEPKVEETVKQPTPVEEPVPVETKKEDVTEEVKTEEEEDVVEEEEDKDKEDSDKDKKDPFEPKKVLSLSHKIHRFDIHKTKQCANDLKALSVDQAKSYSKEICGSLLKQKEIVSLANNGVMKGQGYECKILEAQPEHSHHFSNTLCISEPNTLALGGYSQDAYVQVEMQVWLVEYKENVSCANGTTILQKPAANAYLNELCKALDPDQNIVQLADGLSLIVDNYGCKIQETPAEKNKFALCRTQK